LIWLIYQQTGYYDYVGGLPGGLQRQANLRALYDRARQYEATSLRGLFRFLRFIDRMQDSGNDLGAARAIGEQENVVRIMSIHKSKGLEFPVVFVAGIAKQFNQRDLHHFFLVHKKLGFGPRFVDTDLRITYPSLPQLAIKKRAKLEMLAEEMRVLYVAMTRAREKLIMVGTVPSVYNLLKDWSLLLTRTQPMISNYKLARARSYLDWIGPALIRHPHAQPWRQYIGIDQHTNPIWDNDPSNWQFSMIAAEELRMNAIVSEQQLIQAVDIDTVKRLEPIMIPEVWKPWFDEQFLWTYPHQDALRIFAKTTVSEMKRLSEQTRIREELEAETEQVAEQVAFEPHETHPDQSSNFINPFTAYRRPRFLEQKSTLTAAERGTVMHAVMQNVPLDRPPTTESIEQLLRQMSEKQQLTKEQVDVVHIPHILGFFDTSLGQRMLKATHVQREVPFSYGLPASDVYGIPSTTLQEIVLIQGVIDCMFEDDQGLVMLDYKTDATKSRPIEQLQARYALQISLYRRAVEHILKKRVAQAYLYYFDGSHIVDMLDNH
jgi:ATP-dependent helicase/nuclease subunit A